MEKRKTLTKSWAENCLRQLTEIIKEAEETNQVNEQWFLNFLDELNKLSTKY